MSTWHKYLTFLPCQAQVFSSLFYTNINPQEYLSDLYFKTTFSRPFLYHTGTNMQTNWYVFLIIKETLTERSFMKTKILPISVIVRDRNVSKFNAKQSCRLYAFFIPWRKVILRGLCSNADKNKNKHNS